MRKLIFAFLGLFIVAGLFVWAKSALASSYIHRDWVASDWGSCVSTGPQCGTDNGTQSRTLTCEPTEEGTADCNLGTWVDTTYTYADATCPTNYHYQNTGNWDQRCHRNDRFTVPNCWVWHINHWQASCDEFTSPTGCPETYTKSGSVCRKVDVAGHWENPQTKTESQSCHTGIIDNSACQAVDVCINIPGDQATLPSNMEANSDKFCSCVKGYHPVVADDDETFSCVQDVPPPPEQPAPQPCNGCTGMPVAPSCTDGSTILLPANFQVVRNGANATLKWFQTQGDQVNIFYKEVGAANWTHAVGDVTAKTGNFPNNFNEYTIGGLNPKLGYTFGIMQKHGCGGGQLAISVVVDGPQSRLFQYSYWEWAK